MAELKKQNRRKELERTQYKDEASDESNFSSKQFEEKRSHIWMEEQQNQGRAAKPKYKKHKPLKKCPFCAELIKAEAIKCRFCGEIVDITRRGSMQAHAPMVANQGVSGAQRTWDPGVAAVLSLIIPGAGQIYKGQVAPGILYLIFVPIGYLLFIIPGLILHIVCIVSAASENKSQR